MLRSLLAPAALASLALLPGAAAAASHPPIQVTPASGAAGTRFTISFLAPRTAPKGAYRVVSKAPPQAAAAGNCVASFTFTNPKRVLGHVKLSFAFTPRRAQQLCAGRWTVTVRSVDTGQIVLAGGHFGLHPPLAPG